MKSKALLLAAQPPFEGPWVPISEAVWGVIIRLIPALGKIDGRVFIQVELDGNISTLPMSDVLEQGLKGDKARVLIKAMSDVKSISVTLEEATP